MDIRRYHMGDIDRLDLTVEEIRNFIEGYENNILGGELSISLGRSHVKCPKGRIISMDDFGMGSCSFCPNDMCCFSHVEENVEREKELAKYQEEHPYQAYYGTVIGEQIEAYLRQKHELERLQNYINKVSEEE